MLTQFKSSNDGNVAIMTGAFILLLLVLGGGAVDIIRVTTVRAELQSASDSAVLAAASLSLREEPIVAANNFFNANFDAERYSLGEVDFSATLAVDTQLSRVVNSVATTRVPTLFLKFIDVFNGGNRFETIEIVVTSQAQERIQAIEIAMVLDVSGSMGGQKINNLRTAGSGFIDQIFDGSDPAMISVSLIPFSANVNIDPIIEDYIDPADFPPPGESLASPCIFYEPEDFNDESIVEVRQLVGQPDALGGSSVLNRDICIAEPVLLNSNGRNTLMTAINGLQAGGRTDAHIGLLWGVKSLSPSLRGQLGGDFSSRPIDHGDEVIKALIVMTDGDLNPAEDADGVQRTDDAEAEFTSLCNVARNEGIFVFSIGFQIEDNSQADLLLEACASNLSQYFFVEDLDLESAFDSIAVAISNLRISE